MPQLWVPVVANSPDALAVGADGAIWFTHSLGIGRITTTGEITDFELRAPRDRSRFAQQIALGSDGAVWFTLQDFDEDDDSEEPVGSAIGRIDVTAGHARQLLVARLADKRLHGRRGAMLRVRFTTTRRAGGWLSIVHQKPDVFDWRTITHTRIPAGAHTFACGYRDKPAPTERSFAYTSRRKPAATAHWFTSPSEPPRTYARLRSPSFASACRPSPAGLRACARQP